MRHQRAAFGEARHLVHHGARRGRGLQHAVGDAGELLQLPDAYVGAIAVYLASFHTPLAASNDTASAPALIAQGAAQERTLVDPAQRLFTTACGAYRHDDDGPVLLGQNIALALNGNLHSARPDNRLRVILEGIREPATKDIGFMPAFRHNLNDEQVAQLAGWMR